MRRGILVHPEELTMEWLDWMAEAGLNNLGLHPVGGSVAGESLVRALELKDQPHFQKMLKRAAELGINVEYEAHVMEWLLPRSMFGTHPEWFRVNEEGRRTPDMNFCVSDEEALEYVGERAVELAKRLEQPEHRYYFWLDDVTNCRCMCPKCRELPPSDQHLRAVNVMARALKKWNSQAKICYIAYHDAIDAPQYTMPEENVFLEFAPINRVHAIPIDDPECEPNRHELRDIDRLLEMFGTKDARVLEYWVDNSLYSKYRKPPKQLTLNEKNMERDVRFYRSLGFRDLTSFGCYLGPDYRQLYGRPPVAEYGRVLMNAENVSEE